MVSNKIYEKIFPTSDICEKFSLSSKIHRKFLCKNSKKHWFLIHYHDLKHHLLPPFQDHFPSQRKSTLHCCNLCDTLRYYSESKNDKYHPSEWRLLTARFPTSRFYNGDIECLHSIFHQLFKLPYFQVKSYLFCFLNYFQSLYASIQTFAPKDACR